MEQYQIIAKLRALHSILKECLMDPRDRFFDPQKFLEFFKRYEPLRDALISQDPELFGDLPVREIPPPSKTTDFDGRGYIVRQYLETLIQDIGYALDVLAAIPPVLVPSMKVTREGVFFAGQYFDALRFVAEFVKGAKSSIVLIDGYIGVETLDLLAGKVSGVTAKVLSKSVPPQVKVMAQAFNNQFGGLEVRESKAFHDRFLIVDDKDFYHFGASIKDLGKRGFMFSVIEEPDVLSNLRNKFTLEWGGGNIII